MVRSHAGWHHDYHNFQYACIEEVSYVCEGGHRIHDHWVTTQYADIVWC